MSVLLPEFVASLAELGPAADGLAQALSSTEPPVSVRFNPGKPSPAGLPLAAPVPWCPGAHYLSGRPSFGSDPLFLQGRYYVQEAASMVLAPAVRTALQALQGEEGAEGPLLALDACAAPGGKSTILLDLLPPGSLLVANEIMPKRAAVLRENMVKWGHPGVVVTRTDAPSLSRAFSGYDLVLVDAPCSGEGMMRKDAEAAAQWSPGLVRECAARQQEITRALWEALRPGGVMIYSTCTFNLTENERRVAALMEEQGAESLPVQGLDPAWGIHPSLLPGVEAMRLMPHLTRGEGLFMAVLRKPGAAPGAMEPSGRPAKARKGARGGKAGAVPQAVAQCVARWLRRPCELELTLSAEGRVNAFPAAGRTLLRSLESAVDVIHHGIPAAYIKGRDIIPAQPLALSRALAPGAFPTLELEATQALAACQREPLEASVAAGAPRGHLLLTHGGAGLLFAKNLGTRLNYLR